MKFVTSLVIALTVCLGPHCAWAAGKIDKTKVTSVVSGGKTFYCLERGSKALNVIKRGKKFVLGKDAIKELQKKRAPLKKIRKLKTQVKAGNAACQTGKNNPDESPPSASLTKLSRALTEADVRYLLDKAALGLSSRESALIELGLNQGIDALVSELMRNHDEDPALADMVANLLDGQLNSNTTQTPSGQRAALLYRWINTHNPFQEKFAMALLSIWTVAGDVISDETFRYAWWDYYKLLTDYAYADQALPELAVNITKDPLMLVYLNNELNVKGNPNENYARELMELFTLGPRDLDGNANYTETRFDGSGDIAVAARMLTGWKVNLNYSINKLVAVYDSSRHEPGTHTMFPGTEAEFSGEDYEALVRGIFAHHPGASRYYASELLKLYVTPRPPRELIEAFAAEIRNNDFNLKRAMKVLLQSEAFFDPAYRDTVPMNAFEFAAKTARLLELFGAVNTNEGQRQVSFMGMEPNMAPSVFWYNPEVWVSASVSVEKGAYLSIILGDTTAQGAGNWSVSKVFPAQKLSSKDFALTLIKKVGIHELSQQRVDTLLSYLSNLRASNGTFSPYNFDNTNQNSLKFKGLGLMYILFLSEEFNLL